jgi:hypothetical protein
MILSSKSSSSSRILRTGIRADLSCKVACPFRQHRATAAPDYWHAFLVTFEGRGAPSFKPFELVVDRCDVGTICPLEDVNYLRPALRPRKRKDVRTSPLRGLSLHGRRVNVAPSTIARDIDGRLQLSTRITQRSEQVSTATSHGSKLAEIGLYERLGISRVTDDSLQQLLSMPANCGYNRPAHRKNTCFGINSPVITLHAPSMLDGPIGRCTAMHRPGRQKFGAVTCVSQWNQTDHT